MGFVARIEIQEDGSLLLNNETHQLLREAWWLFREHRDDQSMTYVGDLLEEQMGIDAGKQATEVLVTYMEYRSALEFIYFDTSGSLDSAEQLIQQKRALRESYFGTSMSQELFGEEDAFLTDTLQALLEQELQNNSGYE